MRACSDAKTDCAFVVTDGRVFDAELAGWDSATSLAALRVAGLGVRPIGIENLRASAIWRSPWPARGATS